MFGIGVLLAVVVKQLGYVFAVLLKRVDGKGGDGDVVVEGGSQAFFEDVQRQAGGGDDAGPALLRPAFVAGIVFVVFEQVLQGGLDVFAQVADFVEVEDAVISLGNEARAFLAAKQDGRDVVIVDGGKVGVDEGSIAAGAVLVDVAREVLFASAGVAVDEQWYVLVGQLGGALAQFLGLYAFADEFGRRVDFGFECGILGLQAVGLQGALHGEQQFGTGQRFFEEVVGTEFGGFNGGFDGAVSAHDDDGALQVAVFLPFAQQADAVGVGHPDVEEDELGFVLQVFAARFGGVGSGVGDIAFVAQDVGEGVEDAGFVVDDEDFSTVCGVSHGVLLTGWVAGRVRVILAPPSSRL